jgi:hypothetical protein
MAWPQAALAGSPNSQQWAKQELEGMINAQEHLFWDESNTGVDPGYCSTSSQVQTLTIN